MIVFNIRTHTETHTVEMTTHVPDAHSAMQLLMCLFVFYCVLHVSYNSTENSANPVILLF